VVQKEKKIIFLYYHEGQLYTGEEPPKFFKSWLPAGLPLDVWITLLGNQIWLINPDRYQIKEKKDKYFVWILDKKRHLIEEIWLEHVGLRTEKILFKKGIGDILCTVWFSYNPYGQVHVVKIRDISGSVIEVIYETFDSTPKIYPDVFDLF
jgi:hypothetical protein